ncbi:MAG: L-serine ammonia-lyase [Simkaniaceae bacterium]
MTVSIFDLFSIGIGPSSSHTIGPMRAARDFSLKLSESKKTAKSIIVELFGSLALTGKGHGTDKALLLGLEGWFPEEVEPSKVPAVIDRIHNECSLDLYKQSPIKFYPEKHIVYCKNRRMPFHSNAMRFTAKGRSGEIIQKEVYYSLGGGFIANHDTLHQTKTEQKKFPYPFQNCSELLHICEKNNWSIAEVVWKNELSLRSEAEVKDRILHIWNIMKDSVDRGCRMEGVLPGGLNVRRRAPALYQSLLEKESENLNEAESILDWTSLYALAVNEENAAGSRVVTAPTNGAAGVIPAVLHYMQKYLPAFSEESVVAFFLTAGAIAALFKQGASLSAAEMGCQGEVGVASAMAAGGLAAVLGGDNKQVENAAEIAMEHHLGLTCDPVAGLVQIPCIERNTMGAIKAINAARLAIFNKGQFRVRLDEVIKSMREIGLNMNNKYKETSLGGLAANVSVNNVEC